MPRKGDSLPLTQPQPDLVVSFKTDSLIDDEDFSTKVYSLRDNLSGHVCPEGLDPGQVERAFPFFSIEVKGRRAELDNTKVRFQNLNTASQALYNMYLVMNAADQRNIFFDKVRVYSALATPKDFEVRVHRAVPRYAASVSPIAFQFDTVIRLDADYTHAQVSDIMYGILFTYGVNELHPILRRAVEVVVEDEPERLPPSNTGAKRSAEASFNSESSALRKRLHEL